MSERTVEIPAPPVHLAGDLIVPPDAGGLIVFAHGSGSSRLSRRNRQVAAALNERGLATLLLDLLTVGEEADRANVFDIELLSGRLVAATRWASEHPGTEGLPVGYFGASTGAAARLRCPHRVEVVPGATHLFEEVGALERVAELAAAWFAKLLPEPAR